MTIVRKGHLIDQPLRDAGILDEDQLPLGAGMREQVVDTEIVPLEEELHRLRLLVQSLAPHHRTGDRDAESLR